MYAPQQRPRKKSKAHFSKTRALARSRGQATALKRAHPILRKKSAVTFAGDLGLGGIYAQIEPCQDSHHSPQSLPGRAAVEPPALGRIHSS